VNIAAISVIYHQSALKQQAGIAIMKKAMENMQTDTQALIRMMEQSVHPHKGVHVDTRV